MQGLLEVRRGASVLAQVKHPGAPITDTLHAAIQWRLLFPLIGHFLSLPPAAVFAFAPWAAWLCSDFWSRSFEAEASGFSSPPSVP